MTTPSRSVLGSFLRTPLGVRGGHGIKKGSLSQSMTIAPAVTCVKQRALATTVNQSLKHDYTYNGSGFTDNGVISNPRFEMGNRGANGALVTGVHYYTGRLWVQVTIPAGYSSAPGVFAGHFVSFNNAAGGLGIEFYATMTAPSGFTVVGSSIGTATVGGNFSFNCSMSFTTGQTWYFGCKADSTSEGHIFDNPFTDRFAAFNATLPTLTVG